MLHLILADRDEVGAIDENVSGHQNGIREKTHAGLDSLFDFFLVGDGAFQQTNVGDRAENPCQLSDFGHIGLAEEIALVRIESQGEIIQGHIPRIIAEHLGVLDGRQGMVVSNKEKAQAFGLQGDVLLDRPKIIAQVEFARRLNAAQYPKHRRDLWFGLHCRVGGVFEAHHIS